MVSFKIVNKKHLTSDDGVFYRTKIDTLKYTSKTKDTTLINGKYHLVRKKIVYTPQKMECNWVKAENGDSICYPTRSATSAADYIIGSSPMIDWRTPTQSFEFNYYGECKISTHRPSSDSPGITTSVVGLYEIRKNQIYIYEVLPNWESVEISPIIFSMNSNKDTLLLESDSIKYVVYDSLEIAPFEF